MCRRQVVTTKGNCKRQEMGNANGAGQHAQRQHNNITNHVVKADASRMCLCRKVAVKGRSQSNRTPPCRPIRRVG